MKTQPEMAFFYASVSLAILGTILYQVAQKLTPTQANPFLAITVTYAAALLICLVLLGLNRPQGGILKGLGQLNWTSYVLGASIVAIEFGFLLAFRSGWQISMAAVFVNAAGTLLLLPIGLLFFKERLSPVNTIGILVCMVGLVLMNWRK